MDTAETTTDIIRTFFATYAQALLARDEQAIGRLYAVPALVLFPGQAIAVSDAAQTERFFASMWAQYDGVEAAEPDLTVMGVGPGAIWADVRWSYDGEERERFCYQLTQDEDQGPDGWRIAVLTPMDEHTAKG